LNRQVVAVLILPTFFYPHTSRERLLVELRVLIAAPVFASRIVFPLEVPLLCVLLYSAPTVFSEHHPDLLLLNVDVKNNIPEQIGNNNVWSKHVGERETNTIKDASTFTDRWVLPKHAGMRAISFANLWM
jgi:hypothetical protein